MRPERVEAARLADAVLNRVGADPDDDLTVLARQLLRGREREAALCEVLTELLETLRREAPGTPLNNHRFDALGSKAYAALAKSTAHTQGAGRGEKSQGFSGE